MKLWLSLLGLFLIGSLNARAQAPSAGAIEGTVWDAQNEEALIGATVLAKGTSWGVATDAQGQFKLRLPEGTYDLEVRYFGFETLEIPRVAVASGQTLPMNISLEGSGSLGLEELVVTAALKRESIASLYMQQRKELSMSNGISKEQISKSGDNHTAEVLKRVSGASIQEDKYVVIRGLSDRYNLAMVNQSLMPNTEPDRKSFSFDLIPSNLIDQILVSKTATADLPGDFAGGVVRVYTRDIPAENFHTLGLSLSQNTQTWGRDIHFSTRPAGAVLAFPGNDRALPASFGQGYMDYRAAPLETQWSAAHQLETPYQPKEGKAMPAMHIQHALGAVRRGKQGGEFGWVGGWNYRQSSQVVPRFIRARFETDRVGSYFEDYTTRMQAQLSAMANFTYVRTNHRLSFKNMYYKNFQETFYERHGYTTSNNQEILSYSAVPSERQSFQSQLEGSHLLPWKEWKFNWNLSYMNLWARQDDLRTVFYSRNLSFDKDDNPQPQTNIPYQIVDRNSRRFFSAQQDDTYGASLQFEGPVPGTGQSWKLGYALQQRQRHFDARVFQYGLSGSAFSDGLNENPVGQIFLPSQIGPQGFRLEEITNPTDAYEAKALLQSAFLLFEGKISSDWQWNAGMRWESYEQRLIARDLTNQAMNQRDLFMDFLPSVNMSFQPGDRGKWRLSGSRTVNRPEFREIAPFTFLDLENLWTLNGNPLLKRSQILNLDFRYEHYFSPDEILTAGLFYKWFKDPIEKVMDDQSNLDLFIFGYQNAPQAESYGAELDFRKNLAFLGSPSWLEELYLAGNLTYVVSRVGLKELTGETGYRSMEGQSPYLINFSANYESKENGWGAGILYHRIGHRIAIVGNHTIPTTWEQGRDVLDLQARLQIWDRKAELKFTVSDLFNAPHILYWNANDRNSFQRGANKITEGKDRIIQEYQWGTGLSIGFTYSF